MPEHRTQITFKDNREHISKVNIPNITYPNQHTHIEIPQGSRDHFIVPDTVKVTLNLDIEFKDKACRIVKNVSRALVKKNVLMPRSQKIDTVKNIDKYDTYKDLYLFIYFIYLFFV